MVDALERAWGAQTERTPSRSPAGAAGRWPRSSSPGSRARPCSAPRTPSWPRRWPSSRPAPRPAFVDCNREDLCVSFEDFEAKAERQRPRAAFARPHRRPHRLRDRADRRLLPRARDLPDRGLRPRPRRAAGTAGGREAGATPASTRCTRRRRSRPARAACWCRATTMLVDFARDHRNYGKPDYEVDGLEPPDERVHGRARAGPDRAPRRDRRRGRTRSPARHLDPLFPARARAARRAWSRASTSTSSSSRSRAPPAGSTTSPATGSSAIRARAAEHATGWPRTTPACRSTTTAPSSRRRRAPGRRSRRRHEGPGHRRVRVHRLARGRQAARRRATEPRIFDLAPSPYHSAGGGRRPRRRRHRPRGARPRR